MLDNAQQDKCLIAAAITVHFKPRDFRDSSENSYFTLNTSVAYLFIYLFVSDLNLPPYADVYVRFIILLVQQPSNLAQQIEGDLQTFFEFKNFSCIPQIFFINCRSLLLNFSIRIDNHNAQITILEITSHYIYLFPSFTVASSIW